MYKEHWWHDDDDDDDVRQQNYMKNLSQCHFVQQKLHKDRPGI